MTKEIKMNTIPTTEDAPSTAETLPPEVRKPHGISPYEILSDARGRKKPQDCEQLQDGKMLTGTEE